MIIDAQVSKTITSSVGCQYLVPSKGDEISVVVRDGQGDSAWQGTLQLLQEDGGSAPQSISGVGDHAATSGSELAAQAKGKIIVVHNGDLTSSSGGFTHSIAIAKALIAVLA